MQGGRRRRENDVQKTSPLVTGKKGATKRSNRSYWARYSPSSSKGWCAQRGTRRADRKSAEPAPGQLWMGLKPFWGAQHRAYRARWREADVVPLRDLSLLTGQRCQIKNQKLCGDVAWWHDNLQGCGLTTVSQGTGSILYHIVWGRRTRASLGRSDCHRLQRDAKIAGVSSAARRVRWWLPQKSTSGGRRWFWQKSFPFLPSNRVVLSTTIDARQYGNQRETSLVIFGLRMNRMRRWVFWYAPNWKAGRSELRAGLLPKWNLGKLASTNVQLDNAQWHFAR